MESEMINLDVLTRPFAAGEVASRQGRGGKMMNYVEAYRVIARLNEAFGGAWSFEVETLAFPPTEGTEVVVLGKLTAGGVTKWQFGSSEIDRKRTQDGTQGPPVSIGDDLKSAGSDALKKCATLFGVGLELYARDEAQKPAQQQRPTQGAPATGERRQGSGWTPPPGKEGRSRQAAGGTN